MITEPNQLPGYREAVEQERATRALAFHGALVRIEGFEILPLSLRHYSLLRLVNSPFLPAFETPSPQQLIQFLWLLNPHFTRGDSPEKTAFFAAARERFLPPPPPRWSNWFSRRRWFVKRKVCEINEANAVIAARAFMETMLSDRPDCGTSEEPEYYSDECSIVGTIGEAYGWPRNEIMALSLPEIFQHMKRIREMFYAEHGLPVLMSNPSDEVIQRHLAEANAQN